MNKTLRKVILSKQSQFLCKIRLIKITDAKFPVMGLIENMSGYACPKCGETQPLFKLGGGQALATEMHVPFLGCIPPLKLFLKSTITTPLKHTGPFSKRTSDNFFWPGLVGKTQAQFGFVY